MREYSYDLDFHDDNEEEFPNKYAISAYNAGEHTDQNGDYVCSRVRRELDSFRQVSC